MDENETTEEMGYPVAKSHDRWSVLALGLSWAQQVAAVTTQALGELAIAASQQHHQKKYDGRFKEIVTWEHQ